MGVGKDKYLMKKFFVYTASVIIGTTVMAQQKPHYTQYIINQYIVNPAITGIENYVDIKLSHRMQWVGLLDAPVTTYLTIHGPIGKKDLKTTATSFEPIDQNPRGGRYWDEYAVSEPHHGIGLQVINDRTGPLNNFSGMVTYAYHIGLTARTGFAAGIGAGVSNLSINRDKLQFYNNTVDPAVYSSNLVNSIRFDMNAGIYLYSANYFVGISAQQLVPSKIDYSKSIIKKTEGKNVPHFFGTAGYRFMLGNDINFTPSVMIKYVQPLPIQYELNGKIQYRDLVWFGGGYRYKDGITAMVGMHVSNTFNIGYSYDYTTSNLNSYTRGTHELMLGFIIGNKYGESCPRNIW